MRRKVTPRRLEMNGRAFIVERWPTGNGGMWTAFEDVTPDATRYMVAPTENVQTLRDCKRLIRERTSDER